MITTTRERGRGCLRKYAHARQSKLRSHYYVTTTTPTLIVMVDKMKLERKLSFSLLVLLVAGCLLVVEGRPQGGMFRNLVLKLNEVSKRCPIW